MLREAVKCLTLLMRTTKSYVNGIMPANYTTNSRYAALLLIALVSLLREHGHSKCSLQPFRL
jgi:ornithine cyclodeaminase/alanine dehydrogenase-like protein (mu-crystallin family)